MIHSAVLVTAFITGLLGSVHCIGMCGGIAGALNAGVDRSAGKGHAPFTLAYNVGRILSYTVAGAVAGFAGQRSLAFFAPEHARSVGLAIAGAFMIALGLYIAGWWRGLAVLETAGSGVWRRVEPLSRRWLPIARPWQALAVGAVWGWLPCGLVYATLAWSLSAGGAINGGLLMMAFGFGTLPMLWMLGSASDKLLALRSRPRVRQIAGALIAALGVLTFLGIVTPVHIGHRNSGEASVHSMPANG